MLVAMSKKKPRLQRDREINVHGVTAKGVLSSSRTHTNGIYQGLLL
jgi:hypothetical protein